jgi:hypothetical protein
MLNSAQMRFIGIKAWPFWPYIKFPLHQLCIGTWHGFCYDFRRVIAVMAAYRIFVVQHDYPLATKSASNSIPV